MVNFVPASAAANILRRNLNANNNHPVAEAGFIVISPTTESRATSCGAELSDLEQQLTIFIILPII
jgi:hypothetical protein